MYQISWSRFSGQCLATEFHVGGLKKEQIGVRVAPPVFFSKKHSENMLLQSQARQNVNGRASVQSHSIFF